MARTPVVALKFSPFTLDLSRGLLMLLDERQQLRRQSFAVLRHLAERHGQTVGSSDIIAAVWATPTANPDSSLTQCIKDIRRALGPDHDWMVRTVSGVGYEFVPDVTAVHLTAEPPAPPKADEASASIGDKPDVSPTLEVPPVVRPWPSRLATRVTAALATLAAIALLTVSHRSLPPDNSTAEHTLTMMATPSIAFLPATLAPGSLPTGSLSLADEIATELRRTPRGYDVTIKVAELSQVRDGPLTAVAQSLDVRYFLKTTVHDEAGTRQIAVQLFESPTGRQVWAAPFTLMFDGKHSQNLMAARIARAVAVQIRTVEGHRPLPQRPEAGHFVLQGRVLLESERDADINRRAKALFEQALQLDPKHLQALLGYARTRVVAVNNGWIPALERQKYLHEASAAVDLAIALDRSTVGAHMLRGTIERARGNFDTAVASFEHARTLNPNYAFVHGELGRVKFDMGRPVEAITHIERALSLSPTDPVASIWFLWAGMAAAEMGDFKVSLDWLLKARQANARYKNPQPWIAIAYAKLGDTERARLVVKTHLEESPKFTVAEWLKLLMRGNPQIAVRLEPFAALLRELGAPA